MGVTWPQLREATGERALYAELRPYIDSLSAACSDWPTPADLDRLAVRHDLPVRFIPQPVGERRRGGAASLRGYIHRVHDLRVVPVRPREPHDLFNALTYFAFPRAKLRLAALQAEELRSLEGAPRSGGRGRTRAQDLLTMFDEGGLIAEGSAVIVFGHAIHEHFLDRPGPVRGFAWKREGGPDLDRALCDALTSAAPLADPARFTSMSVVG